MFGLLLKILNFCMNGLIKKVIYRSISIMLTGARRMINLHRLSIRKAVKLFMFLREKKMQLTMKLWEIVKMISCQTGALES